MSMLPSCYRGKNIYSNCHNQCDFIKIRDIDYEICHCQHNFKDNYKPLHNKEITCNLREHYGNRSITLSIKIIHSIIKAV